MKMKLKIKIKTKYFYYETESVSVQRKMNTANQKVKRQTRRSVALVPEYSY
jgi:hypothetical protein